MASTNSNTIRIGILGCAKVVEKNALPSLQNLPGGKLTAIASRDRIKTQEWAAKYNLTAYDSYEELLSSTEIDAVYIPLPIGLHEQWVIAAANHKKHVICEKSLSTSLQSTKNMIEACQKNNVILFENFMCAYHPQHEFVRTTIASGKIGKVRIYKGYFGFPPFEKNSFRYDPILGGGSLNDAGAYTIFMARKIFQTEPIALTSTLEYNTEKGVDIHGSLFAEFPHNQVAITSFGFDQVYQNNYELWGQNGLIKVNRAFSIPPNLAPPIELITNENMTQKTQSPILLPFNQFEAIFIDFIYCINNKNSPIATIEQQHRIQNILNQARCMEAIRISHKENRKVMLLEVN